MFHEKIKAKLLDKSKRKMLERSCLSSKGLCLSYFQV